MALINPMNKLAVGEDFLTFFQCPFHLQRRRYSRAAFRLAQDGFRLLEIPFAPYTDKGSLMMQLYLELGVRLMEAEVRYKRPPPTDDILDELEGVIHYMNDFLTTNFADIVGNEE